MGVINGIDENGWVMMFMHMILEELNIIEECRDRIVTKKANYNALGVSVADTVLDGKVDDLNALIVKIDAIVDGVEKNWLEANTHTSVSTEKLN